MIREQRFRYVGTVFYFTFLLNLLLTDTGLKFGSTLFSDSSQIQVFITALSLGALFFTSDAIGYLLSTIIRFAWNLWGYLAGDGGYSREWKKKLRIPIKENIIKSLSEKPKEEQPNENESIQVALNKYHYDVFVSYFWQRAPKPILEWVTRRHSAMFINWSCILSITLSYCIFIIIILTQKLGWTDLNTIFCIFNSFLFFALLFLSHIARREAWQMVDFWFYNLNHLESGAKLEELDVIRLSRE